MLEQTFTATNFTAKPIHEWTKMAVRDQLAGS